MEKLNISSEELDQIDNGQELNNLENYKVQEELPEFTICGCLQFTGRSGRTYSYRGINSGCVRAVFSKNGRVTSITGNINVRSGNNYNFTHLPGERLGFQCC